MTTPGDSSSGPNRADAAVNGLEALLDRVDLRSYGDYALSDRGAISLPRKVRQDLGLMGEAKLTVFGSSDLGVIVLAADAADPPSAKDDLLARVHARQVAQRAASVRGRVGGRVRAKGAGPATPSDTKESGAQGITGED